MNIIPVREEKILKNLLFSDRNYIDVSFSSWNTRRGMSVRLLLLLFRILILLMNYLCQELFQTVLSLILLLLLKVASYFILLAIQYLWNWCSIPFDTLLFISRHIVSSFPRALFWASFLFTFLLSIFLCSSRIYTE